MAKIYRAQEKWKLDSGFSELDLNIIFLAGSIDMGKAEMWQPEIEEALKDDDVVIFNPRRLDFDATQPYIPENPYMSGQIKWELIHLDRANICVFYFDPNGKAPITLYEMGRVSLRVKCGLATGIVYCPEGYWKRTNVIINAEFDGFIIVESKKELIDTLKRLIKE